MRYDRLLLRLDKAKERYEMEVRQILTDAVRSDANVAEALLKHEPKKSGYSLHGKKLGRPRKLSGLALKRKKTKPHWTQTAKGRKIMAQRTKV